MNDTAADIRAALAHIPAHDRDTWVCMAMAVKSELGEAGFNLWDDWSQSADNYQPKAARAVWKSIKAGGKVSIASLFHEAHRNGWQTSKPYTPPTLEQRQQIEAARLAAQQQAEQEAERLHAEAKAKAAKLWAAAGAVRADHPYLIAKGIKPVGAKQLRGMLVLPLRAGGELVSLQLIGEDGGKRFLTGGQVKGTALTLGSLKDSTEILLCEGWATGCTLHEATGLPVVVAWNAGNLAGTAERLAAALPAAALRVCGDNDASGTGQQAARKAAEVHGMAVWCVPSFTPEQCQQRQENGKDATDFNDLHQLAGLDAVRAGVLANVMVAEPDNGQHPASTPDPLPDASNEDAYIQHLAGLSLLNYGRQRKAAAEALGGVPLGILDKLVNAARKEAEAVQPDDAQGTFVLFEEVEAWPEPVSGDAVLSEALALLQRYVIADKETLRAAVLWCALTWLVDRATVLPLALISAPEKGCGKSVLLEALSHLCFKPLPVASVSAAGMFRAIEKWRPTLFIDEVDTFMRDNPELVGVINSGHTRRNAFVLRTVGEDFEPKAFSTWCAK
ncbi:PriCT-2 domain-containing protein, partial [Chitinilyticum litopenaei]|uniref:PriCT-2 domain-containing protein n=1 Tax=Chitinilyticum litopenaei TaxID=1121276 RepID=UPI001B7FCDE7